MATGPVRSSDGMEPVQRRWHQIMGGKPEGQIFAYGLLAQCADGKLGPWIYIYATVVTVVLEF